MFRKFYIYIDLEITQMLRAKRLSMFMQIFCVSRQTDICRHKTKKMKLIPPRHNTKALDFYRRIFKCDPSVQPLSASSLPRLAYIFKVASLKRRKRPFPTGAFVLSASFLSHLCMHACESTWITRKLCRIRNSRGYALVKIYRQYT